MPAGPAIAEFPSTRWTLILSGREAPARRREILGALLRDYWGPLYVYLRRRGLSSAEAEDAVQGFSLRLLESDVLGRLDPSRGRLRGYLKTALTHHVSNLRASETAERRGGGRTVPLDAELAERLVLEAPDDAEAAFHRAWAQSIFDRALQKLRTEYGQGGRAGPFELIQSYFRGESQLSYAELAAKEKMTVPQLKSFLHRARARFRELVRAEIADTVADASEVDGELQELLRAP